MIILEDFNENTSPSRPCAMTIGSFDGVHLGHQKILQRLRDMVGPKGSVAVFTFSNHPTHVLPGRDPVMLICSKKEKLEFLEKCGVDVVYCIPFTLEFAKMTYAEFLQTLMKNCPFDFLVLGEGACLGKKREGTPELVTDLGAKLGFQTEYLSKLQEGESVISSGSIRKAIKEGNFKQASVLLGRTLKPSSDGTLN
ncbi:MAG: FAD synthetase family protein [Simkaniaceae bacterium]|nr:FAD synthetase family protein [Candidatus Sacchlamyda saccharinae]